MTDPDYRRKVKVQETIRWIEGTLGPAIAAQISVATWARIEERLVADLKVERDVLFSTERRSNP